MHGAMHTPSMQSPSAQVPVQAGRQASSTTSHSMVGPHCAQLLANVVPAGHGFGQSTSVHDSAPSMQVQVLQLMGSGMPGVPSA